MTACVTYGTHMDFRSSLDATVAAHIHAHDIVDVHALALGHLHRSYIMIVHVHALISLAASIASADKRQEPNNRRQTTDRQISLIGIDAPTCRTKQVKLAVSLRYSVVNRLFHGPAVSRLV